MSDPVSPDHYSKGIECWDYIQSQEMDYHRGNVIKYITRAPHKGNALEDYRKAKAYLDRLIAVEVERKKKEAGGAYLDRLKELDYGG